MALACYALNDEVGGGEVRIRACGRHEADDLSGWQRSKKTEGCSDANSRYLTEDSMIKKASATDYTNFGLARLGQ